jgi:WD40 repeat protein
MSLKLKIPFLFFVLSLSACMMATPNLRVIDGETHMSLTQSAPISRGADISPDGKYLLTGGLKGFAYWDISRGRLINRYSAGLPQIMGTYLTTGMIPVAFVSNGKYALSGGEKLKLWDLSSGKVLKTIGSEPAASIGVSADGSTVLTCEESSWSFWEDKLSIFDANSGNKITKWKAGASGGIIALSPDGKYALSSGGGGRKSVKEERGVIHLWDVSRGALAHTFAGTGRNRGIGAAVLAFAFSPDGKYALSGGTDGSVRLWDLASGAELRTIQGHTGWVGTKAVAFAPDGRSVLSVGGSDGLAKLWDLSSGSLIRAFTVSDDRFVGIRRFGGLINGWVAFTPDGKRIIFMGSDASFRIFDVATGDEVATLVSFDDGEWLVVTSEGYYNASEKGAQYLKVQYEGKDFTVDQFYDVFYRPDIVAAKLSGRDITGLTSVTMKDASKNPPPSVEFKTVPSGTDQPKVRVCYEARNAGGGIGEVRLFHNGKLVESDGFYKDMASAGAGDMRISALNSGAIYENMRSIRIRGTGDPSPASTAKAKGDAFQECREIEVIPGENEIGLTAFNRDNTIQGAMKTARFRAKIPGGDPRLYMVFIGIDQYGDNSINLKYAAKDAREIAQKLVRAARTLYKPQNINHVLLINRDATKSGIMTKLDELAAVIRPGDNFILFVAGHGVLLQNQYYMLTHDYTGAMDIRSMINSNEIVEISKKIKSLSQLFIFDTCHAGGVDYIVSGLYDARMSVLAKKMGLHIYASASDKQSAMDGYKGNGLFTYTLLDGLNNNREADRNRDGIVTIVGLGEYSKKTTASLARQIGHSQTPLIINFGKDSAVYKLP